MRTNYFQENSSQVKEYFFLINSLNLLNDQKYPKVINFIITHKAKIDK